METRTNVLQERWKPAQVYFRGIPGDDHMVHLILGSVRLFQDLCVYSLAAFISCLLLTDYCMDVRVGESSHSSRTQFVQYSHTALGDRSVIVYSSDIRLSYLLVPTCCHSCLHSLLISWIWAAQKTAKVMTP